MGISLRQIEVFRAVIEHRSITAAAAALHLSQPAASRLIQNLEAESGLKMFRRERQRLHPTPEAMIFYESVVQIFSGIADLERLATDLGSLATGRLCIVAIPAFGRDILPDCLAEMMRTHPAGDFTLRSHSDTQVVDWVASRQADIGFTMLNVEHPEIVSEVVCAVPALCALPKSHRLAKSRVVTAEDLSKERFISFSSDTQARRRVDAAFRAVNDRRQIPIEVYSSEGACTLVARGVGVALVDPFTGHTFQRRRELVVRRFEPTVPYVFSLIQPRRRGRSLMCERFLGILRRRLGDYLDRYALEPLPEAPAGAGLEARTAAH